MDCWVYSTKGATANNKICISKLLVGFRLKAVAGRCIFARVLHLTSNPAYIPFCYFAPRNINVIINWRVVL